MISYAHFILTAIYLALYPLGFLYISIWSSNKADARTLLYRQVYICCCGVLVGTAAYGWFGLLNFSLTILYSYVLLWLFLGPKCCVGSRLVPVAVFLVAMAHLSYCHAYRQFYNAGNDFDLTGSLMVIVIKVSSVAWNAYDAFHAKKPLSASRQLHALERFPSFLDYCAFLLFFPTFLAGPSLEFNEFKAWLSGSSDSQKDLNLTARDTFWPATQRLLYGILFAVLHLVVLAYFPPSYIATAEFLRLPSSLLDLSGKLFYVYMCVLGFRCKFYFVWIGAEGACIAMGLGARQVDPYSPPPALLFMRTFKSSTLAIEWDAMSNVHVFGVESATSFHTIISEWNIKTQRWLHSYVYERVFDATTSDDVDEKPTPTLRNLATLATYVTSAFWHGFYSGYYLTFVTGAYITSVEKKVYKSVMPRLFSERVTLIGKWVFAQLLLSYTALPFVLLELNLSFDAWKAMLFYAHSFLLLQLLVASFFPAIKPKKKQ